MVEVDQYINDLGDKVDHGMKIHITMITNRIDKHSNPDIYESFMGNLSEYDRKCLRMTQKLMEFVDSVEGDL